MLCKYRSESQWLWSNVCLDISHGNFMLVVMFVGMLEGVPLETHIYHVII
jgi:hypothetical protein